MLKCRFPGSGHHRLSECLLFNSLMGKTANTSLHPLGFGLSIVFLNKFFLTGITFALFILQICANRQVRNIQDSGAIRTCRLA